jgi:hypothetical protein
MPVASTSAAVRNAEPPASGRAALAQPQPSEPSPEGARPPGFAGAQLERGLVRRIGDAHEALDDGREPARVDARHLTAGFWRRAGSLATSPSTSWSRAAAPPGPPSVLAYAGTSVGRGAIDGGSRPAPCVRSQCTGPSGAGGRARARGPAPEGPQKALGGGSRSADLAVHSTMRKSEYSPE